MRNTTDVNMQILHTNHKDFNNEKQYRCHKVAKQIDTGRLED